jgi:predicted RNA-binding protein YlqC (UPF0109 family)
VNVDDNTTADARDETLDDGRVDSADGFEEYEDGELDQDVDGVDEGDFDDAITAASASGDEPANQLRNLVVWIVDQLVDEPENVTVDAVKRGSAVQVQVRLPEADLGKVIGRGGRIAKSMRTALMIVGSRHHLRVSLDIEGQA